MAVKENAVYRIDYSLLQKLGIKPEQIDPRKLRIFGYGSGMMPQPNSSPRQADLPEIAIHVEGENDGRFNKQDYILFYGEGPDKVIFDAQRDIHFYENNLYSDKNFYFLTIGETDGKRIGSLENLGGDFPVISAFNDYVYHEEDKYNILSSGREWFGEKFDNTSTALTLSFSLPGIVSGSNIRIVSDVMGQTYTTGKFKLLFNGTAVAEQSFLPISEARYALKGQNKRDTFLINESIVGASATESQQIKYEFTKGSGFSQAYLDNILIGVKRQLGLYNNQTIFTASESILNATSTFQITNANTGIVWDITDPANINRQEVSREADIITFSTETSILKTFIVFNTKFPSPEPVGKIASQDLHSLSTPNLIIVSHPLFREQAERLANHRQDYSKLSVVVVTPDQIYNEFSSGRQDVVALRDFVKYLYDKNPGTLKSLLIIGKGSYDYKDRITNNVNLVATYESRNSLHPLQTYSSDDFFGFLENHEGQWSEDPVQNHSLDIGVGRFPVKTAEEAKNIVDKLIQYDVDKKAFGYWRKQITFVADDGNSEDGFTSLHQLHANDLADYVESSNPEFETRKLFLGTYQKTARAGGESAPKLTEDIVRTFDKGSLIINYTGHGSEKVWADERVFTDQTIADLDNRLYPFLITATCEFGRQDDPIQTSSAELCVTRKGAGAIGMVTTARPVNATSNFNLNMAFYESLFTRENDRYLTIGEVFRRTKNNSASGVSNRNFSLIGDPSLMLALPVETVHINSLQTLNGSDTLKALSTVRVKGEIQNDSGGLLTDFNGTLEATLFDKQTSFATAGKNDPPFEFTQWHNALFRGKAAVVNGEFEFDFIMTKNIAYTVGQGKFGFYADDRKLHLDAKGVDLDIKIGGTEKNVATDNTPPTIRLFMGDTTFIHGGITAPNTHLVVHLQDASGINISGYGVGNSIVATLDNDETTYVLNDYYRTDVNRYSSGWIEYPIKSLSPGRHSLTVKAWDVYNNPAEAKIDFIVTDGELLVIEDFGNFPNPFLEKTMLFFTHNRSGDDLQAQLFIYSLSGEILKAFEISLPQSDYRQNLIELDNSEDVEKKLAPGVYLSRLIVRSLTNGSKNEQVTKLIILN
jgi:hypothetical protein